MVNRPTIRILRLSHILEILKDGHMDASTIINLLKKRYGTKVIRPILLEDLNQLTKEGKIFKGGDFFSLNKNIVFIYQYPCKHCGSLDTIRFGVRQKSKGYVNPKIDIRQIYKCKSCGRHFDVFINSVAKRKQ